MRKASVDYGIKRCGIAVSDPTATIVGSSMTVPPTAVIKMLREIDDLEEVIVGLPLNLKGIFTPSTRRAVDMAIEIARALPSIPTYLVDERFTSTIANKHIISSNSPRKLVDEMSASILLEEYLLGKIKRHRVVSSLPHISNDMLSFNSFKRLVLISSLRGIESSISMDCMIYEDDPVYFRLREMVISRKKTKISLHFGVFWDIILRVVKDGDLIICDYRHVSECTAHPPKGEIFVMYERPDGKIETLKRIC